MQTISTRSSRRSEPHWLLITVLLAASWSASTALPEVNGQAVQWISDEPGTVPDVGLDSESNLAESATGIEPELPQSDTIHMYSNGGISDLGEALDQYPDMPMDAGQCAVGGHGMAPPCPAPCQESWAPDGLARPWPRDEWLCDGGDELPPVSRDRHRNVRGLTSEDTVAVYQTRRGKTLVQPSNRVCIYAPRFAAVRKIVGPRLDDHFTEAVDVTRPASALQHSVGEPVNHVKQPLLAERLRRSQPPTIYRERIRDEEFVGDRLPYEDIGDLLPFENLQIVKTGRFDATQAPALQKGVAAAQGWSEYAEVQVILDPQLPIVQATYDPVQLTYQVDEEGEPRLRLCKLASTCAAQPGEIVHFTIRYDNNGTEPLPHVTILDHLTVRLEYVADSQRTSLNADFAANEGENGSTVLRWELQETLAPGKGGVIRFQARVR